PEQTRGVDPVSLSAKVKAALIPPPPTRNGKKTKQPFPVFAPVTRLFGARVFSFDISTTFPVFGAPRRPVDRLYFSSTTFSQGLALMGWHATGIRTRRSLNSESSPARSQR